MIVKLSCHAQAWVQKVFFQRGQTKVDVVFFYFAFLKVTRDERTRKPLKAGHVWLASETLI